MSEWDVPLSLNPASGRIIKRSTGADRKRNRRLQEDAPESPTSPTPPNTTEASEYDRLLAAVTSENHPDDVWFVRWAIEQVTRLGEAASLRWRDINLVARRHTKTMHLAQVALTKDLYALPESCFTLCLWDKGQREQAWPETI